MTHQVEIIQAVCPRCAGPRKAFLRGSNTIDGHEDTEFGSVSWSNRALLLECCGCEMHFFREDRYFSESDGVETVYFPKAPSRPRPGWVGSVFLFDIVLKDLLQELYIAAEADLRVMTAIAVRTAFDRATELLGVSADKPFARKLDELLSSGKIGAGEREVLDALVNAGSAAAHRAWKPGAFELQTMITVMESFIHRTIILEGPARRLASAAPRKLAGKPDALKEEDGPAGPVES